MRKIIIYLLAILTILSITACQPTPSTNVVQKKDQDYISGDSQKPSAIIEDSETAIADGYVYPHNVTESINTADKNVEISVDAQVIGPAKNQFDIYDCKPRKFTADELQKVLTYFYPDDLIFERDFEPSLTKSQINQKIIEVKKAISNIDAEPKTESQRQELMNEYNKALKDLEKQYGNAPETVDFKPLTVEQLISQGSASLSCKSKITDDFTGYGLITSNDFEKMRTNSLSLAKTGISKTLNITNKWSLDLAKKASAEIVTECGFADFALFYSKEIINSEDQYRYEFVYTKKSQDILNNYALESNVFPDKNSIFTFFWMPEYITVTIDSQDNCRFQYISPSADGDLLANNVALLPFEKILEFMRAGLKTSNTLIKADDIEKSSSIINKIRFGTLRISKIDSIDEYITVPVWDFYGNTEYFEKGRNPGELFDLETLENTDSVNSLLTINAIDGSIIDRNLGY